MRLLLCSDFSGVGYRYLNRFKEDLKGKTCLYIGYAQDDEFEEESSAAVVLKSMGMNVKFLKEGYDFNEKIDLIFARGGNTTRLVHFLRKFGQYEKIKQLVEQDTIYVGNSAGSILIGSDTEWTLESEPYEVNLKREFGENALLGFGLINKLIFVHCTKFRMAREYERESFGGKEFRTLDTDCYPAYLADIKKYKKDEFIRIGNNQVYFVDGDIHKTITYDWRNIPVKIL